MSKVKSHSGMGRFPRSTFTPRPCWRCGELTHTPLNCRLAPRTPLPAKRETERRSSRVKNPRYLDTCRGWKSGAVCRIKLHYGDQVDECFGEVCPDHERDRTGGGMKSDDETSYPACTKHHDAMETFKLPDATTRESRLAKRRQLCAEHKAAIAWPMKEEQ